MVLTAMPQVQCPFDLNFYLQEVCRHIWIELGVDHCSVLLSISTPIGDPSKQEKKNECENIYISVKNLGKQVFSFNSEVRKIIRVPLNNFSEMTN